MSFKLSVIFSLLLATSLLVHGEEYAQKEVNGIKTAMLGMSSREIAKINGYQCKTDIGKKKTSIDPTTCFAKHQTLFGMKANVFITFAHDEAIFISIRVVSDKPVDLVAAYSADLGPPREFTAPSLAGNTISMAMWLMRSGNSLHINKIKAGARPVIDDITGELMYSHEAIFSGKEGTQQYLQIEQTSKNKKSDY